MSEEKLKMVVVNRQIRFDEKSHIFEGYRLTKEIVDDLIDNKITLESMKEKRTILFGHHEDNFLKEAILSDFSILYEYIYEPVFRDLISEEEYNKALTRNEVIIIKPWWKLKRDHLKPIKKAINTINEYENQQFQLKQYELKVAERDQWVSKISDKWFDGEYKK